MEETVRAREPGPPLRVVTIVSQFWPVIGGAETQARRLAAELVRQGLEVEVWTTRQERAWPRRETLDGVHVRRFGTPLLLGRMVLRRIERWAFLLATFVELVRRRRAYDVVHVHQVLGAAAVAALAGRLAGRPVVARISSTGSTSDLVVAGRWARALARRLLTRVVAMSAQAEAECLRAGYRADRIVRIPNGVHVPIDGDAGAPRPGRFEVLYLGGLRREKRVDLLLQAWTIAGRPGRLTIAGDGAEGEHLRRMADGDDTVRFLGRVEDPRPLVEACDAFVLASDAEGLSNALLEAMAAGRACVATWIGGSVEALGDPAAAPPEPGRHVVGAAGLLVRTGDAPALAGALEALARSPDLRASLGRAARTRCEQRFRLEDVAESYRTLYDALAGRRAGQTAATRS